MQVSRAEHVTTKLSQQFSHRTLVESKSTVQQDIKFVLKIEDGS